MTLGEAAKLRAYWLQNPWVDRRTIHPDNYLDASQILKDHGLITWAHEGDSWAAESQRTIDFALSKGANL